VTVAAGQRDRQGQAAAIDEGVVLVAGTASVDRAWSDGVVPRFGTDVGGVSCGSGPVDPAKGMQFGQQQFVELVPYAGLGPGPEPAPARDPGPIPELNRESVLAHAGDQHKLHPVQTGSVVQPSPTRMPAPSLHRRQQWPDPCPQLVGDLPVGHARPRVCLTVAAEVCMNRCQPQAHERAAYSF
jgi:hypothetical protein